MAGSWMRQSPGAPATSSAGRAPGWLGLGGEARATEAAPPLRSFRCDRMGLPLVGV